MLVKSTSPSRRPFSSVDREQVQAWACRLPQEQAAPLIGAFSEEALEQLHSWAGRAPQEQVASWAHTQTPFPFLQQTIVVNVVVSGVGKC